MNVMYYIASAPMLKWNGLLEPQDLIYQSHDAATKIDKNRKASHLCSKSSEKKPRYSEFAIRIPKGSEDKSI